MAEREELPCSAVAPRPRPNPKRDYACLAAEAMRCVSSTSRVRVLSLAVRALMQAALGTRTTTAPLLSARFATTRLSPATDSTAQCSSHVAPRARRLFNSAPTVGATLACSRCSDTNPPPTHSVRRSGGWTQQSRVRRAHRRHLEFSPPSCAGTRTRANLNCPILLPHHHHSYHHWIPPHRSSVSAPTLTCQSHSTPPSPQSSFRQSHPLHPAPSHR